MAGTDMATRILKIYEALIKGKEIQKIPFCMEHEISERTFDRDIEKIRSFLSEEYTGKEVQYSQDRECYRIPGRREQGELSILEVTLIVKLLKGEQVLEKSEFEGFMKSLLSVVDRGRKEYTGDMIHRESMEYETNHRQVAFLKLFGDLQKCILDRNIIRLRVKKSDNNKENFIFFPVAVEYLTSKFYLLGYQPEKEGLIAFALIEIESFQMTFQKYEEGIAQKYSYQEGKNLLKNMQEKRRRTNEAH